MASPTFFLVLFYYFIFLGALCCTSFSKQQLVKIIKTKHGVYDCIDFYKQPAFSHPLLKQHKSKMLPNSLKELQGRKVSGFGHKEGGCPIGTVPILRSNQNSSNSTLQNPSPDMHCVAIVHTNNLRRRFLGVGGTLVLYKPVVEDNQWSSTRIKLSNGNDSFEAGWMVNPKEFNDHEAHLYASFAAQGNGCINHKCPGFVQVSNVIHLGKTPDSYSVIGSRYKKVWDLLIEKHQDDDNWWLSIIPNKEIIPIGYWSKDLFIPLANVASKVEWGGEIYSHAPTPTTSPPDMGSGLRAENDDLDSGVVMEAKYIDENFTVVYDPEDTHEIQDCRAYSVKDRGYVKHLGRLIRYGGIK